MPDIVILADSVRSPEMPRDPLAMVDPAIYIEREGQRKAWVTGFELERVAGFAGLDVRSALRSSGSTRSRRRGCRTRMRCTR